MFFFRKKMGSWVESDKVKVYVRFVTRVSSGALLSTDIEGEKVMFTSGNKDLNENKDELKKQISLRQIFTGSDYNFKTTDILEKENKDGSVIKYLRFRLRVYGEYGDELYGYISQKDLSGNGQEKYKMYLSNSDSDIQLNENFYIINNTIVLDEGRHISFSSYGNDETVGTFCHIGINSTNLLDHEELNSVVGNLSIDEDDGDILLLELRTNPWP